MAGLDRWRGRQEHSTAAAGGGSGGGYRWRWRQSGGSGCWLLLLRSEALLCRGFAWNRCNPGLCDVRRKLALAIFHFLLLLLDDHFALKAGQVRKLGLARFPVLFDGLLLLDGRQRLGEGGKGGRGEGGER